MAQVEESFPVVGEPFTDAQWRTIIGPEAGIVGDVNGAAYSITLPPSSDVAEVGTATQDSTAVVAGFGHRIPAGTTQSIEIPPSTNAANGRTDVIALRYDPAFTGDPGPVRLFRVAGTEGSTDLPTLDEGPPGEEVLPLWAVTRKAGQGLNQATLRDLRTWKGENAVVSTGRPLGTDVPIGTRARRGGIEFVRQLGASGPEWANASAGTLLGVYGITYATLSDSGRFGPGVRVWNNNPQDIATAAIPDPGVPYRVSFRFGGWWGSEQGGSRWDLDAMVGGATVYTWIPTVEDTSGWRYGGGYKIWTEPPSAATFRGANTFRIRARRITGSDYGAISTNNRHGTLSVWAA